MQGPSSAWDCRAPEPWAEASVGTAASASLRLCRQRSEAGCCPAVPSPTRGDTGQRDQIEAWGPRGRETAKQQPFWSCPACLPLSNLCAPAASGLAEPSVPTYNAWGNGRAGATISMQFDAFISYSTQDKATADAACAALEAAGIRCWIAPRDILPGADWGAAILDALDSCRAMVLIFSSS